MSNLDKSQANIDIQETTQTFCFTTIYLPPPQKKQP